MRRGSSVDAIVQVTAFLFKEGPVDFGLLEEFYPAKENEADSWELLTRDLEEAERPEHAMRDRSQLSFTETVDCYLLRDTIGLQFVTVGERLMTGIDCEVEAIGWEDVIDSDLPKLIELAKEALKEVKVDEPAVFLTLWWYNFNRDPYDGECDSEFGLIQRFKLDDIPEANQ